MKNTQKKQFRNFYLIAKLRNFVKTLDTISRLAFESVVDVDGENVSSKLYVLFKVAALSVVVIFAINLFSIGKSNFGEWGDFFGGVLNPILTFLMFMGLLITIILQQKELREARIEFARSANALENQGAISTRRAFEENFFDMISVLNNVVDQIDLVNSKTKVTTSGKDCFSVFYTRLSKAYKEKSKIHKLTYSDEEILNWSFDIFLQKNEQNLSHYFRLISMIVEYLESSPDDTKIYFKFLNSQFSNRELLLLFYYCVTDQDPTLKERIENHSLLRSTQIEYFLDKNHKDLIDDNAFGNGGIVSCAVRQPVGIR